MAFLCVGLLFWFARELTDRPGLTLSASVLFAAAHWMPLSPFLPVLFLAAAITVALGFARHGFGSHSVVRTIGAGLALCGLGFELQAQGAQSAGIVPTSSQSLSTASVLVALALYAGYERRRGKVAAPVAITPETPPATRTTEAPRRTGGTTPWIALTLLATVAALLLSHVGPVLPFLLLIVAGGMRGLGYRPKWSWHLAFWVLLGAAFVYLLSLGGVAETLGAPRIDLRLLLAFLVPSILASTGISIFGRVFGILSGIVAYAAARREAATALTGFGLAAFSLLAGSLNGNDADAALAFRSLFVAALGDAALRLAASAWRLPERQAPPRPHPAPGSLPRP